jgi:RimJ/RimL family protein N-acetyltransferase
VVTKLISRTGQFTEQEISQRLTTEMANDQEHGLQYWPFFLKQDGVFIGCCGLRPYPAEAGSAELGAHLLPEFWRQGYAREASFAVIAYAFQRLGLRALAAGHNPQNAASARTLLQLGFVRTGEEYYPPTGLLHPSYRLGCCDKSIKRLE